MSDRPDHDDRPRRPYQDPALPVDRRVDDLLSRMELEDKAGLMFHTMALPGDLASADQHFRLPSVRTMVLDRRMNHINLLGSAGSARELAAWGNAVQELARSTPLGIPVTLSTDPRHAFTDNPGASMTAGPFSQWPETLGLAAIRDPEVTRRFADVVRREYLAVGLRVALHPQIDVATEPRWARTGGTFGEDADLTAALGAAYVRGLQGEALGPGSVAAMVKHFPGGGPQKDGEDPHFAYGREQVYPGGMTEYHLRPFLAAFAAGASQVMPYYGMPVGTAWEEVGFGFNRDVVTGVLRERLGFDGIVCTDWGLLTDAEILGTPMPARAWGVEHLSRPERALTALAAGVDQFGGEMCPHVLVELVRSGALAEDRLDVSVRRLLREKFVLGLFDDPFVDADAAERVVGADEFRALGLAAQRASLTLLTNGPARVGVGADDEPAGAAAHDEPVLPLGRDRAVYAEGIDPQALARYARVAATPGEADVAVLRIRAPYDERGEGFEAFFHAGSLAFPDDEVARVAAICAAVPTVLDVYLDRPAILGPLVAAAAAVLVDHGACDEALLDVLVGDAAPAGSLPFDLPRSMAAVEASRPDVPFDTADPLFRFGHGLRY